MGTKKNITIRANFQKDALTKTTPANIHSHLDKIKSCDLVIDF